MQQSPKQDSFSARVPPRETPETKRNPGVSQTPTLHPRTPRHLPPPLQWNSFVRTISRCRCWCRSCNPASGPGRNDIGLAHHARWRDEALLIYRQHPPVHFKFQSDRSAPVSIMRATLPRVIVEGLVKQRTRRSTERTKIFGRSVTVQYSTVLRNITKWISVLYSGCNCK